MSACNFTIEHMEIVRYNIKTGEIVKLHNSDRGLCIRWSNLANPDQILLEPHHRCESYEEQTNRKQIDQRETYVPGKRYVGEGGRTY